MGAPALETLLSRCLRSSHSIRCQRMQNSQRVYSNLDQEEEVAPVQLSPGHFCGGFCGQRGVIFDIFKFQ